MIKLNITETTTCIDGEVPEKLIEEVLTITNSVYSKFDYEKKIWTGVAKRVDVPAVFYDARTKTVPTGIAGAVADWYSANDYDIEWSDSRDISEWNKRNFSWNEIVLRPYQAEARDLLLQATRGFIVIPTGGGKTLISASLIYETGVRTLYIVPSTELKTQALEDFKFVGNVGEAKDLENPPDITVTTLAKLWSLYKKDKEKFTDFVGLFDLAIGDEIHHVNTLVAPKGTKRGNGTWLTIFNELPCYYKFGCTATPGSEGEFSYRSLEMGLGRKAYEISMQELQRLGYLVPVEVHIYDVPIENRSFAWVEAYDNLIGSALFNRTLVSLARKYNKQNLSVVLMVDRIAEHGKVLQEMMPEAFSVFGGTKSKDRAIVKQGLLRGEKLIVLSSVYKEGVDIPSLDVVIMIGGKGDKIVKQKAGRLTRKYEGKTKGILVDFNHLDGMEVWNTKLNKYQHKKHLLEIHSKKRQSIYKELSFEINNKGTL